MIDIGLLFVAAAVGCVAALATGGRLVPGLAVVPVVGVLQGILVLFGAEIAAQLPPKWALVVLALSDQSLLIASMVATAMGALLTAVGMYQVDAPPADTTRVETLHRRPKANPAARKAASEFRYNAVSTPLSAVRDKINLMPSLRPDNPDCPDNRRRGRRRGTLLPGVLVDGGVAYARCAIRDLSPTGARVKLDPQARPLEPQWLVDPTNGIAHRVVGKWRNSSTIGLAIERTLNLKEPGGDDAMRLVKVLQMIQPNELPVAAEPPQPPPAPFPARPKPEATLALRDGVGNT